jgi:hypothetical protein
LFQGQAGKAAGLPIRGGAAKSPKDGGVFANRIDLVHECSARFTTRRLIVTYSLLWWLLHWAEWQKDTIPQKLTQASK